MLLDEYHAASAANQHGPAVRALELIGKHLGMFTDRLILEKVEKESDEELAAAMARGADGTVDPVLFGQALTMIKGGAVGHA